jgi:hypothetical protein
MGDYWEDNVDDNFSSERKVLNRYYACLSAQFLQAAWFLRIVPDVYFKFVAFNQRCKELGIDLPVELEKYVHTSIGIEIISPKYGTLHVFGPADYEVHLHQKGEYFLTKPSIGLEGSHFLDVIGIISNLQEIYLDKYFGEIREMHRFGYVQDRHIDLHAARKLESLSLIFEAWYMVLQEELTPDQDEHLRFFAYVTAGTDNDFFCKLYLPGKESYNQTCLIVHQTEPWMNVLEREKSDITQKIFSALFRAAQNPNRP